jgi:hypothetical protein
MLNINIRNLIDRYKILRDAPDAVMIGKDFNISCNVFHRDKRENPIWAIKKEGNSIEFAVIDAAVIIGTIVTVITLLCSIKCLYRKLRYDKRW